ncbi:hypothetical protein HK413_06590 [Mucilaginibacter sp. S1162]|uniref:Uncharacterized protein n=1 Tax=Mucilaginibacter humi TaxID=2732510 RepID=A0ABX1W103_9SPHI|nr:hypothetical protein [Mucilaginibacter humi]NNU33896.1 hypothetical protein [Mucilaginibacter humi]
MITPLAVTYGFNRNAAFKYKKLQGEYLPLIPPLHLLSSLSRELKLDGAVFKTLSFKAEADINAAQQRYRR